MTTRDVIAANIRTLRDLHGLSQIDLARRVGLSRRTIARLEAAEIGDPGIDQLGSLAVALGVTVGHLTTSPLVVVSLPVPQAMAERLAGPQGAQLLESLCRH